MAEAAKTAATPNAEAAPQKSWPVEHPAAVGNADPAPLPRAFLVMKAVSTPGSMEARSVTTKKATKVASRFYMGGIMPREGAPGGCRGKGPPRTTTVEPGDPDLRGSCQPRGTPVQRSLSPSLAPVSEVLVAVGEVMTPSA